MVYVVSTWLACMRCMSSHLQEGSLVRFQGVARRMRDVDVNIVYSERGLGFY